MLEANDAHDNTEMSETEEVDLSDSTILIVDDNAQNRELLEAYLDALPCETVKAENGIDALKIVENSPPDLILLDIMMPKMSGFEVCERLKSNPDTRNIPVIMVTALNEVGDVERGVEVGTDEFISKPFDKLVLITRVKSLLRTRLLKQQLDQNAARKIEAERKSDVDHQTSPNE